LSRFSVANGAYSPGVKAGNTVCVSGILAMDADVNIVGPGDVCAQTRQVIEASQATRGV